MKQLKAFDEQKVKVQLITGLQPDGSNNFTYIDDQVMSDWPKTVDSEAMLQATEINLVSSIWRLSGKLGISQSRELNLFHDLSKKFWRCQIVSHVTKILQKPLT